MLNNFLSALLKNERGASAVEYGLILGLVFVVIFTSLVAMGVHVTDLWDSLSDQYPKT